KGLLPGPTMQRPGLIVPVLVPIIIIVVVIIVIIPDDVMFLGVRVIPPPGQLLAQPDRGGAPVRARARVAAIAVGTGSNTAGGVIIVIVAVVLIALPGKRIVQ